MWCQNRTVGLGPAAKSGGPREGSGRQETAKEACADVKWEKGLVGKTAEGKILNRGG